MSPYVRVFAIALVVFGALLLPSSAFAHERREVGPYLFVVGFMNEPAFEGEQNGLYLRITDAATEAPVENAQETLQATVVKGAASQPLELEPAFNEPGVYHAVFYPTEDGDYTFQFSGTINDTPVEETFTSSPDGFHGVAAPDELQFPAKVPSTATISTELVAAQSTARTALVLGGASLGVGLLSLIAAGLIAMRSRRTNAVRGSSLA